MQRLNLVVINRSANGDHLSVLDRLKDLANITIGNTVDELSGPARNADVVLNGMNRGEQLRTLWPQLQKIRWVHSLSAGVENTLFPELIESPIPLTNARGVFAPALGEFAIGAVFFFAKDFRRMVRNQAAHKWEQFLVDMVQGKVLGVVGYGEIGRAAAERGHAMGMKVAALRRRPERSKVDPIVDQNFPPDQLHDLLGISDYVVVATPLTRETRGMIGEKELRAMKRSAVIINVGRGPVIEEAPLICALKENWIRGAALDVFDEEPLPEKHPFWDMENVLLSPHCADQTKTWLHEATEFFVQNFERFARGEELLNVVDKRAGY
jgi:phosphoglycerate dehydrogenase-like enzyme